MPTKRTKRAGTVRAKGDGLGKRSGASPQAAPRVDPSIANVAAYPGGPDRSAYGPPPSDFKGELPPPPAIIGQSTTSAKSLAPLPIVDRFPIIIGAGLSFAYLSAQQRTALTGYRMGYVDLLREILERDPHLFSVVFKPIRAVANGRLEVSPADLPKDHPDTERAREIADDIAARVRRIRGLKQSIASLGWGSYYGVAAAENHYRYDTRDGWLITHLGFIHSRRLSYPDMGSWDLYIWDQGQVLSAQAFGSSPTNAPCFGLRVADFPHKFIVYAPQLSGDYPTREGSGRLVAEWALIKRAAARNALRYLEQFSKPIPEVTYNTADPDTDGASKGREATDEDIQLGQTAANAIASGTLAAFTHADALKLTLNTPEARNNKITFDKLLEVCNEEESKATVGSTLTTNVGAHGGNRALGEVHQSEEKNVFVFFADMMSEALREQLITPLVVLNHDDAEHLIPKIRIHVEDEGSKEFLKLASDAAKMNVPVDAYEVAREIGLPVIPNPEGIEFRMMPLDVTAPLDLHPEMAPVPPSDTLGGQKLENARIRAESRNTPPSAGQPPSKAGKPPDKKKDPS